MNFLARQQKLRGQLAPSKLDALLISHLPNIRYLSGFTGSAGFLLVTESGSVFFTDVRYDTQAREEVKGAKVVIARKNVLTALGEWLATRPAQLKIWNRRCLKNLSGPAVSRLVSQNLSLTGRP